MTLLSANKQIYHGIRWVATTAGVAAACVGSSANPVRRIHEPLCRSLFPGKRENREAIEATADALFEAYGAGAYSEARLRVRAADDFVTMRHWSAVGEAIARTSGARSDHDAALGAAMDPLLGQCFGALDVDEAACRQALAEQKREEPSPPIPAVRGRS